MIFTRTCVKHVLFGSGYFSLFVVDFFVLKVLFEGLMVFVFESWVCFNDVLSFLPGESGEFRVFECFHHKVRDTRLADAGKFAATAGFKILLSKSEAIVGACKGFEAF